MKRTRRAVLAALVLAAALGGGAARSYQPADAGQRAEKAPILPEQFLRGYDPVTAYFGSDEGPGRGDADDGAKRLKITPAWPGAWFWLDRRTLQFRPAEPWPALARFQVESEAGRKVLTTMMAPPSALSPADGSEDLRPFRSFTLTFPQALPIASLRKMLSLELRDLPGFGDQRPVKVDRFGLAQLPRGSQRDPAAYAVTLEEAVPEGKQLRVRVSLALGDEGTVLWTGRLSTQPPFHLAKVRCGGAESPVVAGGGAAREAALACGNRGEKPELIFSAPPKDLTLSALKRLVRLEPAVQDLSFEASGSRVALKGRFLPDVLYRLRLEDGPVRDDAGRALRATGGVELFFHLGARTPFVRWSQGTAILEANGPRTLPLVGYGEARADVRIYRLDPLHPGLWPFPQNGVTVDEDRAPPFPGEEPADPELSQGPRGELAAHLRLLGSPLVSRVVSLPLEKRAGTTKFGLDLAPLLDPAVGRNRPGTYLVGLRRLAGPPQRAYVRVQVTNLTLSVAEERERAVLFVRTLDEAKPVSGARIRLDGRRWEEVFQNGRKARVDRPASVEVTTDGDGRAQLGRLVDWTRILRIDVSKGEDHLVLDPGEAPPRFAANHWSVSGRFLEWLLSDPPPPANEKLVAFLITERPIYKPGETVHVKGWLRQKKGGQLLAPGPATDYLLRLDLPDGRTVGLPLAFTKLGGFTADWTDKDPPTGELKAVLVKRQGGEVLGERAFRVEAYRIPTFEVQLSGAAVAPLDAPIPVKAVARYYAGGAASGQKIRWNVTQRPTLHVPKGREGFLFASSAQFARPGAARPPSAVRRDAVLDVQGADTMKVNPALDVDGSPRVYRFEATVTGPDEQEVSAAHEVRALPPFVLGMKLERYQEKAREVVPRVVAVGPDDKAVKGQEVAVRLYRRVWHSQLRESAFATGEAKYVTEQEDVKVGEKVIRTEADAVAVPFAIKDAGVYVVELTGRDKLGRVQTLSADLYAGGPGPVAWQRPKEGLFTVVPDKKSYVPGETAKLVLESPFQSARALVVVEEPTGNVYRWLDVSGAKGVAEVGIGPQHVPNLPVHVVLFRGRIGEGTNDDSRYRPQTVAASLELEVEPAPNRVAVKVEHPASVRPGSKAELVVTLKDERGRPLAGEVTLWLVDEAVLSLAKEGPLDPLARFIERNRSATSIRDTRNLVLGRILEEEEPGGDGGEEADEAGGRARTVRKNFQTVPYWQATLEVPASGRLVVPVTLSDDLTDFRVRAVAASGFSRFGVHQSTLHVRLPVLVQPQLPRLVREGDRFWPGGVARMLEGAEGAGVVDIQLSGPVDAKKAKVPVKLDLQRPASALSAATVTAVGGPSTLTVKVGVTRTSDGVGDAFEVKVPVAPDRNVEHFAQIARLGPGPAKLPGFPEPPRAGTATQEVVVTSIPGVLELVSSLDYLSAYVHECLEQRASRLFGEVALAGTLRDLGLGDLYGARSLAEAKRFVGDLAVHQDGKGLLAFWPGTPGDVGLTAQVVELSYALKGAGVELDSKVIGRAEEALKRVLRSDFPFLAGYRYNQQTAAMRALARGGKLDEHYLADLFQHRSEMDAISLADLAWSMSRRPEPFRANLDVLRQELWETVVVKLRDGKEFVEKIQRDRSGWSWSWLGSTPGTFATVWRGLLALDPKNPRQDLVRDALLSQARPAVGFGDTWSNRRGLEALADYLARPRPDLPAGTLSLDGAGELTVDGTRKAARLGRRSEQPLAGTVKGTPLGVRVAYDYLPAAPGSEVKALRQGFVVTRSWSPVREDGTVAPPVEDKAADRRKVKPGDVLEIHARLVSDEERGWVALVVPFAAGLEPLNPALANSGPLARPSEPDSLQPTFVQRLDGEVRYYFARLPRGSHAFHFRVRAASEGSFVHPAPWAEMMYRQEVRGRGEGMRVVVVGEHEKG
ncbi:MAG TPA: MG2 domain-containing protein [Anaeromyxobacteraceae bacterium]|nr:MG2 domain-containing protein [Anaeromyxobacteraceae bacterium]